MNETFSTVLQMYSDSLNLHPIWQDCKKTPREQHISNAKKKVKDKEGNPYDLLRSVLTVQLHLTQLPFP